MDQNIQNRIISYDEPKIKVKRIKTFIGADGKTYNGSYEDYISGRAQVRNDLGGAGQADSISKAETNRPS